MYKSCPYLPPGKTSDYTGDLIQLPENHRVDDLTVISQEASSTLLFINPIARFGY